MTALTEQEVLAKLARLLNRTLDPYVLDYAERQDWISDVFAEVASGVELEEAVESLKERYLQAAELRASGRAGSGGSGVELWGDDVRGQALARIFAADASG